MRKESKMATLQPFSYAVSSIADEIDTNFYNIKQKYGYLFDIPVFHPRQIITKNHAHITLKRSSFLRSEVREGDVVNVLRSVSFHPFVINTKGVEILKTHNHGNVAVILVELTEELKKLHEDIVDSLEPLLENNDPYDQKKFLPHLSVFYNVPGDHIDDVTDIIRKELLPISFTLSSFVLLKEVQGVKGVRDIVEEFR